MREKMKDEFTRDVSSTMIKFLKKGGILYPFTKFVKKRDDKLALGFRGSSSDIVTIYKHNHMVWSLEYSGKGNPKVKISLNQARFTPNWAEKVKDLMDLGFKPEAKKNESKSYEELEEKGELVKNSNDAIDLVAEIDKNTKTRKFVEESYKIINEFLDNYLDDPKPKSKENSNKENFNKEKKKNFIKKYWLENHPDDIKKSIEEDIISRRQYKLEKRVQQDLFMRNHCFDNGFFIYDSEFKQPKDVTLINGSDKDLKNTPDLFGIRFELGKPVAICMIEVKSTESALKGNSGVKMHREGMEKYLNIVRNDSKRGEVRLMEDRKLEAWRIINQYSKLGLYDVQKKFFDMCPKEEEFLKLEEEIIFVFTNGIDLETEIKDAKKPVKVFLRGYEAYNDMKSGDVSGKICVVKRQYDLKEE